MAILAGLPKLSLKNYLSWNKTDNRLDYFSMYIVLNRKARIVKPKTGWGLLALANRLGLPKLTTENYISGKKTDNLIELTSDTFPSERDPINLNKQRLVGAHQPSPHP
ncbi:MAG: hypothetical protein RL246_1610 [Bacteroidota bacterium]